MDFRLEACVELHATETGDLVFLYCVKPSPSTDFVPFVGASVPLEWATSFESDLVLLFGEEMTPEATFYDMALTSQISKEFFGKRPIAVARMLDMEGDSLPTTATAIECVDSRWEYYCNGKEEIR